MGVEGLRGEVWMAELNGKRRPVVIVNQNMTAAEIDRVLATVTSKEPRNIYDVRLSSWKEAGLKAPSVVRCSKLNTMLFSDLVHRIGSLTDDDLDLVLDKIHEFFKK